jgi:hypothetical protein
MNDPAKKKDRIVPALREGDFENATPFAWDWKTDSFAKIIGKIIMRVQFEKSILYESDGGPNFLDIVLFENNLEMMTTTRK